MSSRGNNVQAAHVPYAAIEATIEHFILIQLLHDM